MARDAAPPTAPLPHTCITTLNMGLDVVASDTVVEDKLNTLAKFLAGGTGMDFLILIRQTVWILEYTGVGCHNRFAPCPHGVSDSDFAESHTGT